MEKLGNRYDILLPTAEQISRIIKKFNPNKAAGPDKIAPEIAILSANITDFHLANIINHDLGNNSFSEGVRIATVRPIYEKGDCRPVCILNCFLKMYERLLHGQINPFAETFLLEFAAAYRVKYSCNHVAMRLIEN